MPDWRRVGSHLIITKGKDDDGEDLIHCHVPDNSREVRELLQAAINDLGLTESLDFVPMNKKEPPDRILFHSKMRIGDSICFSGGLRDFHNAYPNVKMGILGKAEHLFDCNPYINYEVTQDNTEVCYVGPGEMTNASNRLNVSLVDAFRYKMEKESGLLIPAGENRGDLWFSEDEYNEKPEIEFPYVIICVSEGAWNLKTYPLEMWQEFVDQNKHILFVSVGNKGDVSKKGKLTGNNVQDMTGLTEDPNTGIRRLMKLFLNAEASVGLVSFHMHMMGAFGKPSVVVAGAREPMHFTKYQGHQYLSTEGCLSCGLKGCWKCQAFDGKKQNCSELITKKGINKDQPYPFCVDLIEPVDISRALNLYYKGGRLDHDKRTEKFNSAGKPLYKNVVKEYRMMPHLKFVSQEELEAKYIEPQWVDKSTGKKFCFGGGALTHKDFNFLLQQLEKYELRGD